MKTNPPREGFSKGTIHGLIVAIPLLCVLVVLAFVTDVQPRSAEAVALDLLLAICVSVMAVWVVGGLFEFEGTLYDVSVKGAGGIAVIVFFVAWVRPFYTVAESSNYVDVELISGEGLSFILDEVNDSYHQGKSDMFIDYQDDHVDQFRPMPIDEPISLHGRSWREILERIGRKAECLNVSIDGNAILLSLDMKKARSVKREGRPPLFTC